MEILKLLTENELTTKEIQKETGFELNLIQVYLNQFKKSDKVKKIGNKGRFAIYKAKVESLKGNNGIDTQILKKLIIPFAKSKIIVKLFPNEQKRIKILFGEVKNG